MNSLPSRALASKPLFRFGLVANWKADSPVKERRGGPKPRLRFKKAIVAMGGEMLKVVHHPPTREKP